MTILILNPDVNSHARASIHESAAMYAKINRQLETIKCELEMPLLVNPRESPLPCREPVEETAEINAHFSAQIHALFKELAAYHARSAASPDENLATIDDEKGVELDITIICQSFTRFPHCQHLIYHARRLTLLEPEMLPELSFVRKFTIGTEKYGQCRDFHFSRVRPISLCVPMECLVRLTGVTELDCPWLWEWLPVASASRPIRHFTRVWEGPWRDARHEFGTAMEKREGISGLRLPTTLTKARLWFTRPKPVWEEDQAIPMPDLVSPAQKDPLSVGLCILAAQLEEFNLRAFLTEHLFPDAASSTQWSRMRQLTIEFQALRPDGSWYFVGPRGEDPHPKGFAIFDEHYPPLQTTAEDEEMDEQYDEDPQGGEEVDDFPDVFRTKPVPEKVEPLLAAFVTAVKNMDALEDAELFAYLAWYPSDKRAEEYGDEAPCDSQKSVHRWGVRYLAGDEDRAQGVVQWQVGDWRPSRSVMRLFEDLGRQEWLDFEYEAWTDTQYRRLEY